MVLMVSIPTMSVLKFVPSAGQADLSLILLETQKKGFLVNISFMYLSTLACLNNSEQDDLHYKKQVTFTPA